MSNPIILHTRSERANNANLCTQKKVAKNSDHAASVVAHAHILADHVTHSISYSQETHYLSCGSQNKAPIV